MMNSASKVVFWISLYFALSQPCLSSKSTVAQCPRPKDSFPVRTGSVNTVLYCVHARQKRIPFLCETMLISTKSAFQTQSCSSTSCMYYIHDTCTDVGNSALTKCGFAAKLSFRRENLAFSSTCFFSLWNKLRLAHARLLGVVIV